MSETLTVAPRKEFHTLFDAPLVLDLDTLSDIGTHIGILGLPYGAPYSMEDVTCDQSNAPTAIRRSWQRALRSLERWDFDLGGKQMYLWRAVLVRILQAEKAVAPEIRR
jgi:agmatinase